MLQIQVHTLTSEIIGEPFFSKYVSHPIKKTIETTKTPPNITPSKYFHPYLQEWTLKIRVLTKTDLRTFTNAKGHGHVFSFDVIDIDGSEIHKLHASISRQHTFILP